MAHTLIKPDGSHCLSAWLAGQPDSPLKDRLLLALRLADQVQTLHRSGRIHRAIHVDTLAVNGQLEPTLPPAPDVRRFGGNDSDPEFCPPELTAGASIELPAATEAAADVLKKAGYSIDPRRIDLYQLGVVFCQLVTGQRVLSYIYDARIKAQLPAAVQPLLERTLGFESPERFENCEQLIEALNRASQQTESPGPSRAMRDTPSRGSCLLLRDDTPPQGTPQPSSVPAGQSLPFERLGHYRIVEQIGSGGMGDVYRGYDESLDRDVAIKVLPPQFARDAEFVRRFHAEATAAAGIAHPNVVPIYFIGDDAGYHFFAMQYVVGESLAERLHHRGHFPVDEALELIGQCLSGLQAAHSRGLIHRDIKPGNVLIERQSGRAMLLDFGLVRRLNDAARMTSTGVIMGTVDYIAPEQARGRPVDGRTDIYSLGVLFYQLLSGRMPFSADSPTAMIFQHAYEKPFPLDEAMPGLPPPVVQIVYRMMAKNPDARYPDCMVAMADIQAYRQGRPLMPLLAAAGAAEQTPAERVRHAPKSVAEMPLSIAELEWPEELPHGLESAPRQRIRDWAATMFRRHAPECVQEMQGTVQQMDAAVAHYQRRCNRLVELLEEAHSLKSELPPRQVEDLERQLGVAETTLARLRSQQDLFKARLRAAEARRQMEGGLPERKRHRRLVQIAFGAALLALGSTLLILPYSREVRFSEPGPPVELPEPAASPQANHKVVTEDIGREGFGSGTALSLPVNGLAETDRIVPTEFPSHWRSKDAFAKITGPGRIVFPTLPVSAYVLEADVTVRNPAGKLTFLLGDRDYSTALVIGHMWKDADKEVKQIRYRLFSFHPFGVNWAGARDYDPGTQLQLKIVVPDSQRNWLYVNGLPALSAPGAAADLTLRIETEPDSDATIHTLALRKLNEEDVKKLGLQMPQRRISPGLDVAATRLGRETVGLKEVPQQGNAFRASTTGTVMNWIGPGEFVMGAPHAAYGQFGKGVQRVRLTKGYWIGRYRVTQGEWERLMGNNPSRMQGSPYLPVNWISWVDALRFCRKLTDTEKQHGRVPEGHEYRLPTEAEWEYACLAGAEGRSAPGVDLLGGRLSTELKAPLWRGEVGQEPPNAWGLCGMPGNVPEWCADVWRPYPADGQTRVVLDRFEPGGLDVDRFVVRGGSFPIAADKYVGSASVRFRATPTVAGDYRGFRLVLGRELKLWDGGKPASAVPSKRALDADKFSRTEGIRKSGSANKPASNPPGGTIAGSSGMNLHCEAEAATLATLELKEAAHSTVIRSWQIHTPATFTLDPSDVAPDSYNLYVSARGYASQVINIRSSHDAVHPMSQNVTLYRKRYVVFRSASNHDGSRDLSSGKTQQGRVAVSHWGQS